MNFHSSQIPIWKQRSSRGDEPVVWVGTVPWLSFSDRMEETRTRKYEATPLSLTLQEKYCSLHCKLLQQSQYNIILFVGLSRCPTSSESAGTEFYLWPGYSPAFLLSFPCLHYRSLPYRSWPETSFLEVSKYVCHGNRFSSMINTFERSSIQLFPGSCELFLQMPTWRTLPRTGHIWKMPMGHGACLHRCILVLKQQVHLGPITHFFLWNSIWMEIICLTE